MMNRLVHDMKNRTLHTKDNINIAINHYQNHHDKVVIVAPGWCMTKDSAAFCKISEMFAKFYDVISFYKYRADY